MFSVKDSGARQEFESGMVRDTAAGKMAPHRCMDGPMFRRWAAHLAKGATKYPDVEPGKANWLLAAGPVEVARFRESAFRHFLQWYNGDSDEDHAAAVFFNINGAEYVRERMRKEQADARDTSEGQATGVEEAAGDDGAVRELPDAGVCDATVFPALDISRAVDAWPDQGEAEQGECSEA